MIEYEGRKVSLDSFSDIESLQTTKSMFTKTTATPSESSTTISDGVSSKTTTGMVTVPFPIYA
jgi:hypothetical protein